MSMVLKFKIMRLSSFDKIKVKKPHQSIPQPPKKKIKKIPDILAFFSKHIMTGNEIPSS